MGLFEDVVVNAKSAANVVGKKAGQLVDISKLRLSAADLEKEISEKLKALGCLVYDEKKTGEDSSSLIEQNIASIDELREELKEINDELASVKNQTICPKCGETNPKNFAYCGYCGEKLNEDQPQDEIPKEDTAKKE